MWRQAPVGRGSRVSATVRDDATTRARVTAARALEGAPRESLRECRDVSDQVRQRGIRSALPFLARRSTDGPLHGQGRPEIRLPLRDVRRPHAGDRTRTLLVGYDRPDQCRRLHARRHRQVVRPDGPHLQRRRCHPRRHRPGHLRLRAVHRRPGSTLRLRGATPSAKSRSSRTSGRPCWHAPRATPCSSPRRPRRWASIQGPCHSESGYLAPSHGARACARRSSRNSV